MAKVHIAGMGVMGALTAYQLHARNIEFTWHDVEPEEKERQVSPTDYFTAYHASTGAIFPTGKADDMRCLRLWQGEFGQVYPPRVLSGAHWWFSSKKPPHEAQMTVAEEVGPLKRGSETSLHVDAQFLVQKARAEFAASRIPLAEITKNPGLINNIGVHLIAHGWGQRLTHVYWGWTRKIKLKFHDEIPPNSAFYFRKNRFFIRYAYPIGGSGWWYAGSTITKQKEAKHVPGRAEREYLKWKADFLELTGGLVEIVEEGPHIEGWRPAMGGMHDDSLEQYSVQLLEPNHLRNPVIGLYPSRSHDGIRRFPDIWKQVESLLIREGLLNEVVSSS